MALGGAKVKYLSGILRNLGTSEKTKKGISESFQWTHHLSTQRDTTCKYAVCD